MTERYEKVGSIFALGIGIFYLVNAFSISTYTPNPQDIGSRAYPLVVGGLFTVLSVIWVVKAFKTKADSEPIHAEGNGFSWLRWLLLLVLLFIAVALLQPVGFIPVSAMFIFTSILVMFWSKPSWTQLIIFLVVAVAGAFAVKVLLGDVLGIYLP